MKKMIRKAAVIMTMAIALLGPAAKNTYAATKAVETDYRRWKTNDSRWGKVLLGNTQGAKTIGNAGCAVTSYSKMLIQAGIKTSAFTPDKANKWLKDNGKFNKKTAKDKNGNYIGACIASWKGIADIDSRITYDKQINNPTNKQIMNLVNDKDANYDYYMLLMVKGGGHYVTVYNEGSKAAKKPVILDCANVSDLSYNVSGPIDRYGKVNAAYVYKVKVSKPAATASTASAATAKIAVQTAPKTTAPKTTAPKTSTLALQNQLLPEGTLIKGSPFTIGGNIVSNTNIKNVTVTVSTKAGAKKFSKSIAPNATSFCLFRVDSAMKFSSLPAGSYTVTVSAQDQITTKTWKTQFSVKAATVTISNYSCPAATLKKGSAFHVKGTLKSSAAIKKVTVSVYSTAGKKMYEAAAAPGAKSYDLKKLDGKIAFQKLAAGTYIYRVAVQDNSGAVKYAITKSFTVK